MSEDIKEEVKTRRKRTVTTQSKINSIDKKIEKQHKILDELMAEKDKLVKQLEKEEATKKKESIKTIINELKESGVSIEEIKELLG